MLEQLVLEVASSLITSDSDRLRVLETDLLGQLRIVDSALRKRLKDVRGPRLRRSPRTIRESTQKKEAPEQELPAEIQRAIDDGAGRWDSRTSEEAVRFIKGMQWVAPALPPIDLVGAQAKLDAACGGMTTVKDNVLDYLASWEWARQHDAELPGKVLCMLGPPGVGKTAIADVVSEVMGRTLIRVPMGGVDDVFLIGAD